MFMRFALAAVAGGIIGYLIGTAGKGSGGSCPFLCNPWGGMIFFAVLAVTLASMLKTDRVPDYQPSAFLIEIAEVAEFDRVLAENRVVLVDFYADWCPPCRALKPTIHALADEYQGRAAVVAVNVDKVRPLAQKYEVQGIPDVQVFQDGKQQARIIGRQDAEKYRAELNRFLNQDAVKSE